MRNQNAGSGDLRRPAKSDRTSLLFALIATACISGGYVLILSLGYGPYNWFVSLYSFAVLRGIKEWFIAWAVLWVASVQHNARPYSRIIPVLCIVSLVALDNWVIYASISYGNVLLVWIPVVLVEICNLCWMYVGVLLAILVTKTRLVRSTENRTRNQISWLSKSQTKKRFFRSVSLASGSLLFICLAAIGLWCLFNAGRWPNYMRIMDALTLIVVAPAFRFLCGLAVIAFLFLVAFANRRAMGAGIALLFSIVFILYSVYLPVWGSQFAMFGLIGNGISTLSSLWRIPLVLALSPLTGFFLGGMVIYLCGYQFIPTRTIGVSEVEKHIDEIEPSELDDGLDSEMYL